MNIFSGVMKLAQLVLLLCLVSNVFGGYVYKFQMFSGNDMPQLSPSRGMPTECGLSSTDKGAARRGHGMSGIARLGKEQSLNYRMRRHSQNMQEDDNVAYDNSNDNDESEDGDQGDGDKDNDDGDSNHGDSNDGDRNDGDNGDEDNDDEDNGTRKYGLLFVDTDDRSYADRIVGGQVAEYGEFPWQVTVNVLLEAGGETRSVFDCGGVIINEWWILSAGHCFNGRSESDITLIVGNHYLSRKDSGEAAFAVERIIVHPGYNGNDPDNDIALVKIRPSANGQGIQFNKYVQPVRLPGVGTTFPEGTPCFISGWGRIAAGGPGSDVLLKTDSPIVNQARCREVYASIGVIVKGRTICSGNVKGGNGACGGDSGGGLICKTEDGYVLAGIVSHGVPCARPNFITLFSLVPKFIPWIRSNVQD